MLYVGLPVCNIAEVPFPLDTVRHPSPSMQVPAIQCESKKFPRGFLTFSPNGWKFLVQILRAYYTFLSNLR